MTHRWKIHLTAAAQRDIGVILRWTVENFGRRQARIYEKTLTDALHHLAQGPLADGCCRREDFGPAIHFLHVARKRRKRRHFIVFRADTATGEHVVEVIRLLHDSMDLTRHLPPIDHDI